MANKRKDVISLPKIFIDERENRFKNKKTWTQTTIGYVYNEDDNNYNSFPKSPYESKLDQMKDETYVNHAHTNVIRLVEIWGSAVMTLANEIRMSIEYRWNVAIRVATWAQELVTATKTGLPQCNGLSIEAMSLRFIVENVNGIDDEEQALLLQKISCCEKFQVTLVITSNHCDIVTKFDCEEEGYLFGKVE